MDKSALRRHGIEARKALVGAQLFSRKICTNLLKHPLYNDAKTIFSYVPFNGEVDVSDFNRQARLDRKVVAFPICGSSCSMVAAVPESELAWESGKYGIKTPVRELSRILYPYKIDIIIVPCTVFDPKTKNRIGMGAGFYDRYLHKCSDAFRIAVAFEIQKNSFSADEWDVKIDTILTELRWY